MERKITKINKSNNYLKRDKQPFNYQGSKWLYPSQYKEEDEKILNRNEKRSFQEVLKDTK